MTQDQWLLVAFKASLVASAASIALFIVVYTLLAPWWKNEIGKTIIYKDLLLLAALCVSIASLFFGFNRLTSRVAFWIDVIVFAAMTPVMLWRCAIFLRFHLSPPDRRLSWPQVARETRTRVWTRLTTSRRR